MDSTCEKITFPEPTGSFIHEKAIVHLRAMSSRRPVPYDDGLIGCISHGSSPMIQVLLSIENRRKGIDDASVLTTHPKILITNQSEKGNYLFQYIY
jgi:hypothetical protein